MTITDFFWILAAVTLLCGLGLGILGAGFAGALITGAGALLAAIAMTADNR
jgi:hypothetical protein